LKKKLYLFLVSVMLWGFIPLSAVAENIIRVQHKLTSVIRNGETVSFDNPPTVGNLLVVFSGHRFGENDPAITNGDGWTRHILIATTPNNRTIAMWSKVADGNDMDVTIDWKGDSEREAWVILKEFSGTEDWQFFDAAFAEANNAGTELTVGPTAIAASGRVLAIAATVFRGDVENPKYANHDMEGVIHYAYSEPKNPHQLVHGLTGFAFSLDGNFAWETTASWGNERFATGVLALFRIGEFTVKTYTLTVTNGSGSGEYEEGEVVNIAANTAPVGQKFAAWTGDVANVADVNSPTTTITMPAGVATITATYQVETSVESLTEKQIISLYPNPVHNGQLKVVLANQGKALAQIFDVTGRLALTTHVQKGSNTINVDDLPNGLYIVKISSSHKVTSQRFIIEK
jgi:hypothetical protein